MGYQKNGFTLVEVLLVLSILGIMLLLVIPFNHLLLENEKERQFINVFTSDILLMQSLSRTTLDEVRLKYLNTEQKYLINKGGEKSLVERELPRSWEIQMRTYKNIKFTNSGAIDKLGNIVLKTKHHKYKFIFSLGKGRFRIEKD